MTDHPLAGVPQEVLDVAYAAVGAWQVMDGVPDVEVRYVSDALVANLNSRGYVTWPGRAPDRDSLVLAIFMAIGHAVDDLDDERATAEVVVDEVVLPLLRQLCGEANA